MTDALFSSPSDMILIEKSPKAMPPVYARMCQRARQIVSRFPQPAFYRDFWPLQEISRSFFRTNPVLKSLYAFVSEHLEDDFGHGLDHAVKVTVDAGVLMLIEGRRFGYSHAYTEQRVIIVQSAGLLHDIKRKMKHHAAEGAEYARRTLRSYPYAPDEIEDICQAIRNHEAFQPRSNFNTLEGALVADCLYDADKFRWGPDNFSHTVWDMVSFFNLPLSEFLCRYPGAMDGLLKIRQTFRTQTGKAYGPEFIDLGIAIGKELLEVIQAEFAVNS
jgi:hypothetical protein